MAIGWDEKINWGAGKRMKEEARKRTELKMKYEAQYVFSKGELAALKKFILDDDGNKIKKNDHFDDEDFEI
jgi:hypothetical protein